MRPDAGRDRPAMRLNTVVLPAPERPKSAVMPWLVVNCASSRKEPAPKRALNSSIAAGGAHVSAPQQELGAHQRAEREQDRERAKAQRLGVAAGHLGEAVD